MSEKAKAFARLAVALFALALVFLIAFGVIDADSLTMAVTAVLAIGSEILAWWKNNNVTSEAIEAQKYLEILYSNPCGMKLTARITTNYRQLKTIYAQRKTHRLPEWRAFCEWIEKLPYANLIT